MSGIIWDTFIALHSSDILRKLNKEVNVLLLFPLPRSNFDHTQQFWERYKGFKIPLDILEEGLTRDILLHFAPRLVYGTLTNLNLFY